MQIAGDPLRTSEFLNQLVQRPEDILENAEERLGTYKDIMLHPLEVRKCKIIGLCITKDLLKYLALFSFFFFKFWDLSYGGGHKACYNISPSSEIHTEIGGTKLSSLGVVSTLESR